MHTIYGRVVGFAGYFVNLDGEVYSQRTKAGNIDKGKFTRLEHNSDNKGYHRVTLSVGNKQTRRLVHRLVIETFLDRTPPMVNHKSGVTMDNRLENLEASNAKHNEQHSWEKLGKKHSEESRMNRSKTMRGSKCGTVSVQYSKDKVLEVLSLEGTMANHRIASKCSISRGGVTNILNASKINIYYTGTKRIQHVVICTLSA